MNPEMPDPARTKPSPVVGSLLHVLTLAIGLFFVGWNGRDLYYLLVDPLPSPRSAVVHEGLENLYRTLLDEMDRQKSDPLQAPAAAAKRVEALLKIYEASMPELHLNAEGMGDVRPALRRASEYLSLASLAGWELRRMVKDENVKGMESEARANILMALSEIRSAVISVGAAPWDLVKYERDSRIQHIAINLGFGALCTGLLLYLFMDRRFKEMEAHDVMTSFAVANPPPWAVGGSAKPKTRDMVVTIDETSVVRGGTDSSAAAPQSEGVRMPESKPAPVATMAAAEPAHGTDAARQIAASAARSFQHDLTVINGYSDLLLDSIAEEDPIRLDLKAIRRAGERANVLAGQLQIYGNTKPDRWEQVDVNKWLESARTRFEALLPGEVKLGYDLSPHAGIVRGDPDHLEQAVKSLILNATNAMPSGGGLTLKTGFHEPSKGEFWTSITVTDTGLGIDAPRQRKILLPAPSENQVEPGLGLPVVTSILEQHQGHVELESQPGQGSSFHLLIPRVSVAPRTFVRRR